MKHSRNLVRLVILLALILIGLFHVPGGGLQPKASANKAPGALPSAVAPAPDIWSSPPRVGVLSDGRLEVFVVGSHGALWHNWQVSGGWSGWYSLGGILDGDLEVARNPFGGLEVFASAGASESTPSSLWHIWQWTGGVWSGWASLGGGVIGTPAIARRRLVRLEFSRR